jgi:hypothetical protein
MGEYTRGVVGNAYGLGGNNHTLFVFESGFSDSNTKNVC